MIKPEEVTIGMTLVHNAKGEIKVLGIKPHNGRYAIFYDLSWVYLHNCKKK